MDIVIRSEENSDVFNWSSSGYSVTEPGENERGRYSMYSMSIGCRRGFGEGGRFVDVPIFLLHAHGRGLPSIQIDSGLAAEEIFQKPYTVERAKKAYFVALSKAENPDQAIELVVEQVFSYGENRGQMDAKANLRKALGL